MKHLASQSGFTLVELLTTISIFAILSVGGAALIITSFRTNGIIWEQLATQNDGRQVIQEVIDDVRRAETSSIGSYAVDTTDEYEFIFYANVDGDADRERVRYWHTNNTLYKGVIHPSGSPLAYEEADEEVRLLASSVKNEDEGTPVFEYYDESYIGVGASLVQPVTTTDVRVVRVTVQLEEDPSQSPEPYTVESIVFMRNLKQN